MTYGVIINGTNTKTAHDLILLADLSIQHSEARTAKVEVPGRDGFWDFTEVLAGGPTFGNTQISFSLYKRVPDAELYALRNQLATAYHGKVVDLILPVAPSKTFHGRMSIGASGSGKIAFAMDAEP